MIYFISTVYGELAQLARASALHAGGQGFKSLILHQVCFKEELINSFFLFQKSKLYVIIKLEYRRDVVCFAQIVEEELRKIKKHA